MGQEERREEEAVVPTPGFGCYLRRIREDRKLSLKDVGKMSSGYPERLTPSHLSRIENGRATPTFLRLFALSQIYGVTVSSLAERFEMEYKRETAPAAIEGKTEDEVMEEARKMRIAGFHREALGLYEGLLERHAAAAKRRLKPLLGGFKPPVEGLPSQPDPRERIIELRLHCVNCLVQLARYASAKDQCENLLSDDALTARQRVITLHFLAMCCYRLDKLTVAMLVLEQAEREVADLEDADDQRGYLATLKGNVLFLTGRPEAAAEALREAVAIWDKLKRPFEACRERVNLASALIDAGDTKLAEQYLQKALEIAEASGYERPRALALSNMALVAYREGNFERTEALCLRSNSIARPREFYSVIFRNCFYLWEIAKARSDLAGIRANERALRTYLHRVEEHMPEAREYRKQLEGVES